MDQLQEQAKPAVADLLDADEDQLFEKLGILEQAGKQNPSILASFSADISYNADAMGVLDDVRNIGRRFFDGISRDCYKLVCSDDAENSEERNKVISAFGIGKTEVAAALAALLVSQFTLAPAMRLLRRRLL
jgi:hypothetical protein